MLGQPGPDLTLRGLQTEDPMRFKLIQEYRTVKGDLIHPNSRPIANVCMYVCVYMYICMYLYNSQVDFGGVWWWW